MKQNISQIKTEKGLVNDPIEIANGLNAHFNSVFVKDDGLSNPNFKQRCLDLIFMDQCDFSQLKISFLLKDLEDGTAPGPDFIYAEILSRCIDS